MELSSGGREQHALLLRRYLDSLPDKQAAIQTAWQQVAADDWASTAVAALRDLAHRLAGSAGSYGLNELGWAARALDEALEPPVSDREGRDLASRCVVELLDALQKKT